MIFKNAIVFFLFGLLPLLAFGNAFQRGLQQFDEKQYEAAIESFTEFLAENSSHEASLFNRGIAYMQIENYEAAIADFSKLVTFNPDDANVKNQLANALIALANEYFENDESDKAMDYLEQYLQLRPEDDVAWFNIGQIYSRKEERKKAIRCYTNAIEMNPDADYFFNRAIDYYFMEANDSSLADLTKVLNIRQEDTTALWFRAKIFYLQNDYEKAQADLNTLLKLNPNHTAARDLESALRITLFFKNNIVWFGLLLVIGLLGLFFAVRAFKKKS